MCLEGTGRGGGSAEMILKCWSRSDTLNGPTCTLREMTRLHQLDWQRSRHFQKDRHSFPFQGDRSPHHPKDRHSDPPDTRTDTRMPPRCPLESPLPPAHAPPALLSLLSQAVPA